MPLLPAPHPLPAIVATAVTAPLPFLCRMILTDAMALLYRSHYAFGEAHRLRNAAGTPPPLPLLSAAATLCNGRASWRKQLPPCLTRPACLLLCLHSAGEDTTVLFGFLNTLLNLLELAPPPTHFAVVFDAPGKNFRC